MKRISNFTADRMDMQEMAAISGGATASQRFMSGATATFIAPGGDVFGAMARDIWHPCGTEEITNLYVNYFKILRVVPKPELVAEIHPGDSNPIFVRP